MLNVFDGGTADGGWTLFIADTSEGGIGSLDSWSLQVTGNPPTGLTVPDNGNALELLAMGFSVVRRKYYNIKVARLAGTGLLFGT